MIQVYVIIVWKGISQTFLLDCLKFKQFQENLILFAHPEQIPICLNSFLSNHKMFQKLYEYVIKTKKIFND